MGTPGWPCEEGSGNGLQVGCMQPVLEPALSPGCCVWPWDSWISPRTLLLMSMTLGRVYVQSCMWVGTALWVPGQGAPESSAGRVSNMEARHSQHLYP